MRIAFLNVSEYRDNIKMPVQGIQENIMAATRAGHGIRAIVFRNGQWSYIPEEPDKMNRNAKK
jgi:hypothetical protein